MSIARACQGMEAKKMAEKRLHMRVGAHSCSLSFVRMVMLLAFPCVLLPNCRILRSLPSLLASGSETRFDFQWGKSGSTAVNLGSALSEGDVAVRIPAGLDNPSEKRLSVPLDNSNASASNVAPHVERRAKRDESKSAQVSKSSKKDDPFKATEFFDKLPFTVAKVNQKSANRKWIMYNKPLKTGSTTRSIQLRECLFDRGYRLENLNTSFPGDNNDPIGVQLAVSSKPKMMSTRHGRYGLWELAGLKASGEYKTCFVTSVRNPSDRVPSHALQIVMKEMVRLGDEPFNKTKDEMAVAVCRGIGRVDLQYLVHYMVGMNSASKRGWSPEQVRLLAKKFVDTYDIIVDESGKILHDSSHSECAEVRTCLRDWNVPPVNVKIGGKKLKYSCAGMVERVIEEEKVFYNEVIRLSKT